MQVIPFPQPADPAPEHVSSDQHGKPMFRFVCEYGHGALLSGAARLWTFDLWAYDLADAEARLLAVRNATLAGQLLEDGVL